MPDASLQETVASVWREEAPRLIGALTRITRDVSLAEDLAQDALVAALKNWRDHGAPANPAAWLMTTAKRRTVDHVRRAETLRRKTEEIGHAVRIAEEVQAMTDLDSHIDQIEDDVLRLMFLCAHPALSAESRAALTLRLVGGLTTTEIARGFLVPDATMGQRISRAKKTVTRQGIDIDLPTGADRVDRLDDVMAVVYLIFNEGYVATAGEHWARTDLTAEAIRLARLLADIAPDEPEVHGLQALLELQASRLPARTDDNGQAVLLDDQDRGLWDELLIRRGLAALGRAQRLAARGAPVGRYFLQAAIAAEHARATNAEETDWLRIAQLYDVLASAAPGPIVEVNRAVAHGRAHGPDAGLEILDAIASDALAESPLVPSVRGDLLAHLGSPGPAADQFEEAARRTRNASERELLERRAAKARTGA